MTPLQLVLRYLEAFCPADIDALWSDPPEVAEFELIGSYENATSACLVYQYSKPEISTPMAQMFKARDGKICEILLIFDAREFA